MEGAVLLMGLLVAAGFVGDVAPSSPWDSFHARELAWESVGSRGFAAPGIAMSSGLLNTVGGRAGGSPANPVFLQCQEADMVVTVKRDLFGTGMLVEAEDLRLGAAFCRYTALNATDNTVTFQVLLQDCGNTLQISSDSLIYNSILTYNPTQSSSTAIIRSNPVSIVIECIYPRKGNTSSDAIKPTWSPFSSTVYAQGQLSFSLRLMNDNWSAVRTSTAFHLGDVFHIEASLDTGSHASMKVFVDGCVATISADKNSTPSYNIIAANGCLVDGKMPDSSSAFRSPRTQPDKLQFTVDAFKFIGDTSSLVYITCNLKAVDATQAANSLNKACSYSKVSGGWSPLEGFSSICSCCDTGNCALASPIIGSSRFGASGSRHNKRAIMTKSEETVAVLGPLVVMPKTKTTVLPSQVKEPWTMLSLTLVTMMLVLAVVLPTAVVLYKRIKDSEVPPDNLQ